MIILPFIGSKFPAINLISVDFPLPFAPTKAILESFEILKLMFFNTGISSYPASTLLIVSIDVPKLLGFGNEKLIVLSLIIASTISIFSKDLNLL